jgi:putative membrane protein
MTRPRLFLLGLALLSAAWLAPQHTFSAHMTAHMAVVAFAAPLLALGISGGAWDLLKRWPGGGSPLVASLIEFAVVWLWHMPLLHEAARRNTFVLFAEQASFLASGIALWITIFGGGAGRSAERGALGIVALLLTLMHMTLLGALLALSPRPLYAGHHGVDALRDQELGGVIMIAAGAVSYIAGALWLASGLLRESGRAGFGDGLVLLTRPAADADRPDHFPLSLQRNATGKDHHAAVIARMDSIELVTGLAVLGESAGLDVEGARSPRLVDRDVDTPNPGAIHPDVRH